MCLANRKHHNGKSIVDLERGTITSNLDFKSLLPPPHPFM